ncbi:MAG: radical SAM protein [Candidatus Atribacteria bacterium]|nr:radical SAM protein [Candidatus Atribacteria bacterium]
MIAFGPVPSRRLGRSLGINNIPFKHCSYNCVYCQLGETRYQHLKTADFYSPKQIFQSVQEKLQKLLEKNEKVDYLTFVADGEPTLDKNLGETIDLLRDLKVKIAVITNGSLLRSERTRNSLSNCDLVSLKIDSGFSAVWKRVNQPVDELNWEEFIFGLKAFAKNFNGQIITESMLVKGLNDSEENIESIAQFIGELRVTTAFISAPIRPPVKKWVTYPEESVFLKAYQIYSRNDKVPKVELLMNYEGNDFSIGEKVEEDFLAIISVHPMREDAVRDFLKKVHLSWGFIEDLLANKKITCLSYQNYQYFMRKNVNREE